jgi:recombination protein RecR
MYPNSIKNLIESFKYLPGIGEKTAERMAFAILDLDLDQVESFSSNMIDVKNKIHRCSICNNLTEDDICSICSNENRNDGSLVVVDDPKTVFVFENMGFFKGKYHVLDGLISPIDGINPEDIGISKLVDRVNTKKFNEVIFAFKPSIEGETTALYIKRVLSGLNIKTTRLASGVPMGADMEYIDSLTLERALSDRKEIE